MKLKHVVIGLFVLVVAVVVAGFAVLSTLDINQYRDEIIAEAEKATGRTLRIDGEMDLRVSLTPAVVLNDVGLSNAEWAEAEEMVSVRRFELEVAILPLLSSQLEIKRLILVEPNIQLETQADGTPNWAMEVGEPSGEPESADGEEGEKLQASFEEVLIQDARLTFKNGETGETLSLSLDSLTAQAPSASAPLELDAAGSYQDVGFTLGGSLSSLAVLTDPDAEKSLDLKGTLGSAEFSALGKVLLAAATPSANLGLTFKAENLDDIAKLSGAALPPLSGIEVATQVALSGQTVKLTDLDAKVANSDLSGGLTLVGGAVPSVTGTIQSDTIDLRDFAGEESAGGGEAAPAAGSDSPYVIPDTPLPLDFLRAAVVDVNLAVGSLILNDTMTLEQTQGTVGLKDGRLTLTPVKTILGDGQLALNTTLDSNPAKPALDFGFTANEVDYGKLLREQGVYDKMRGKIGADIALTGAGGSPRAIASTLNGKIDIEGGEGQLDNRLLKILTAGVDQLNQLFSKEESNKLNCILIRFDVENGVATSQAIVIDSNALTISGGGTVDLRTEELDLYFDTSTKQASLASLAVPFRVQGTMKNPRVLPDLAGTALQVAKTAGVVVNPVAGIGALLATDAVSGGEEGTACAAAVEQAQSGSSGGGVEEILKDPAAAIEKVLPGGDSSGDGSGGAGGGAEDAVKGVTEGLKGLFGN